MTAEPTTTSTEDHDGPLFASEPCPYDCVSCSAGLILNEPETAEAECEARRAGPCPWHNRRRGERDDGPRSGYLKD